MITTARVIDDEAAAFAAEVGPSGPVAVEGNRTRWSAGGLLAAEARLLRAPAGVVEYRPEEMTVQVRAGTAVADLHAELAEAGQRTALPDRGGTVGGAIAVGENDLHQLGRGMIRHSILQVRYVSAEGRVITGGGPTVKNVTGFDLPRLFVGSLGTIGLLAEAIIRTNPIPAAGLWLRSDDTDPVAVHDAVRNASAILWNGTSTWVHLEGHAVDVEDTRRQLGAIGTFAETGEGPDLPNHRWSLEPAELTRLDRHDTGDFVASIGIGLVLASNPQPTRALEPSLTELHRRIKDQFDPSGRLNPGRDPAVR